MITLSILITLVLGLVASQLIEHERNTRYIELEDRADYIADLASQSMAFPVWNVDLVAIEEQLTSLVSNPEVIQCYVSAVGFGELGNVTESLETQGDPIERTRNITFTTAETGSQIIGEISVVLTRTLVEQAITDFHRVMWLLVLAILIVIYGATYLLLQRVIKAPVNRLEVMVDRIAQGDLEARCTVESGDELGRLAVRVNTMADRLGESSLSLRDSEKRLKLVLDGSQLGYWDWNIESGDVVRNDRWAEMLGYTLEEVDNTVIQWTDLHHPDDKEIAWKAINDHLEGRSALYKAEYRMRTKDGQYRWILDQAMVVTRDQQGHPLRMCGTHTDITDQKRAENEREKLQNQLSQSQKMESVGQLAGGVAHDFNNMLSVILGYSEIAMKQVEPTSSLFEIFQEILTAGKRSADIVGQLLAFARKQTVIPKVLHPNEIIAGMLKMLRRLIGEDITLKWLPGTELNPIKMDPSQITQLLANLCVNARDAITGVGTINVETRGVNISKDYCQDHPGFVEGDFLLLIVSDDGCGMDKAILNKIFDPFFTTKEVGQGTGLGLATVYGIVKQNKGFVNVYSEVGHGTTFNIYLPVQQGDPRTFSTDNNAIEKKGGDETILIVEDDERLLKLGKRMLESLGYNVLQANTPAEAIYLVDSALDTIHLVLTDVIMPDMNGRDLADHLLSLDSGLKILFMSGYTADVISNRGMLNEGVCFMHKPFTIEDLALKVRESLEKSDCH